MVDAEVQDKAVLLRVLTVDDSSVARKQVSRCLQTVGVEVVALNDGRQALNYLRQLVEEGKKPEEEFLMMISDIEMPEMDGYTLTAEIRSDPRKNCTSACILRFPGCSTRRWSRRSALMTSWPVQAGRPGPAGGRPDQGSAH